MASKTLVVLTVILLVLSLAALGMAMFKKVPAAPSTAEGKVMAYVAESGASAEPMTTTGKVLVNVVVPENTTP